LDPHIGVHLLIGIDDYLKHLSCFSPYDFNFGAFRESVQAARWQNDFDAFTGVKPFPNLAAEKKSREKYDHRQNHENADSLIGISKPGMPVINTHRITSISLRAVNRKR
jgi:hypothetical protein